MHCTLTPLVFPVDPLSPPVFRPSRSLLVERIWEDDCCFPADTLKPDHYHIPINFPVWGQLLKQLRHCAIRQLYKQVIHLWKTQTQEKKKRKKEEVGLNSCVETRLGFIPSGHTVTFDPACDSGWDLSVQAAARAWSKPLWQRWSCWMSYSQDVSTWQQTESHWSHMLSHWGQERVNQAVDIVNWDSVT